MPINNRTEAAGNVKKQTQEIQQTERGVEEFPTPHPPFTQRCTFVQF